jgi:hypothetical protein
VTDQPKPPLTVDAIFREIWADDGLMEPVVMGIPEAKAAIGELMRQAVGQTHNQTIDDAINIIQRDHILDPQIIAERIAQLRNKEQSV